LLGLDSGIADALNVGVDANIIASEVDEVIGVI
jgi:hypothetical protein